MITLLSTVIVLLHGSLLESSSNKSAVLQLKRLLDESCHIIRLVLECPVMVTSMFSIAATPVCNI